MSQEKLQKRTTVYLQQPRDYEISGCSCGNENTQWSEYESHLWCDKCNIDFKPKHKGIFDGPIGIGMVSLFGIYFHRLNLETNEVEAFTSKGEYVKAINLYINVDFQKKHEINLKNGENKVKAYLDINDFSLSLENPSIDSGRYEVTVFTISNNQEFKEWNLFVHYKNEKFSWEENQIFDFFKKFILNQKLEYNLPETNKSKPNKI